MGVGFPETANGNINAPVIMLAEKAADLILATEPPAPETPEDPVPRMGLENAWNKSLPRTLQRVFGRLEMVNKKLAAAVVLTLAVNVAWGAPSVERGRYIVGIAGCNDCHTDGYTETGGEVPVEDWLLGSSFGWTGPWGTTYATNLRLSAPQKTEDEWVDYAKNLQAKPPMPWFSLHHMTEDDLRSVYRFIRSLGADGEAAPDALPPGQAPEGPHAVFP